MNTQYRKNLKSIATACKDYTDNKVELVKNELLYKIGAYDITTSDDSTSAYQKSVPSGATSVMLHSIKGASYKYGQLANCSTITTNIPMNNISSSTFDNFNTSHKFLISFNYEFSGSYSGCSFYFGIWNNGLTAYKRTFVGPSALSRTYYGIVSTWEEGSLADTNNVKVVVQMLGSISESNTCKTSNVQLFDLTSDFGAGNEPTSVSDARTAYLARGVNIDEYNAYSQPTIRDTKVSKVDVVGFNKWDEETEVGSFIGGTLNSKNYIRVIPNREYYLKAPYACGIVYYDTSKTEIRRGVSSANSVFTTPSNCSFIKFYCSSDYGTTYNNDICINISDNTLNGTYKPYYHRELEIPSAVQQMTNYGKGINSSVCSMLKFVVDEENNVLNVYLVENIVYVANLSNLTWTYNSGDSSYRSPLSAIGGKSQGYALMSNYLQVSGDTTVIGGFYIGQNNINVFANEGNTPTGTMICQTSTTTTTDITSYFDTNCISVEENSTITFENTYNASMPSEITYLVEEVKA